MFDNARSAATTPTFDNYTHLWRLQRLYLPLTTTPTFDDYNDYTHHWRLHPPLTATPTFDNYTHLLRLHSPSTTTTTIQRLQPPLTTTPIFVDYSTFDNYTHLWSSRRWRSCCPREGRGAVWRWLRWGPWSWGSSGCCGSGSLPASCWLTNSSVVPCFGNWTVVGSVELYSDLFMFASKHTFK